MIRPRDIPYRAWLLAVFLLALVVSAIRPHHPDDFLAEHALTVATFVAIVAIERRQPLSNVAYTLLFVFMLLHVVGAHYSYSFVPYDHYSRHLLGASVSETFSFSRNHFDRLVHLMFGLLILQPMRELVQRRMGPSGGGGASGGLWVLLIAMGFLAMLSMAYELLEWLYAAVASPEAADLYNGQQGDVFDAQKDMALALGGSTTAALVIIVLGTLRRRPSAR